jgi:hypothetical protein
MSAVVIDTNVLLVANKKHEDVLPECVMECVRTLQGIQTQTQDTIVVDSEWRILSEYLNKTKPNQPKGVGDVFLKWLLQNPARLSQVNLTETAKDEFAEFPDAALQAQFDPPDRKFAAVAHAHPDKPLVLQATDCKWLDWWPNLQIAGVNIRFLCPADVQRFYQKKFPDKPLPDLP